MMDQVEKSRITVIGFSGFTSPKKMDEEAEKLLLVLKNNGMETDGEPFPDALQSSLEPALPAQE